MTEDSTIRRKLRSSRLDDPTGWTYTYWLPSLPIPASTPTGLYYFSTYVPAPDADGNDNRASATQNWNNSIAVARTERGRHRWRPQSASINYCLCFEALRQPNLAFVCLAIMRSWSGLIDRSAVATMYQLGFDFQARVLIGEVNESFENKTCDLRTPPMTLQVGDDVCGCADFAGKCRGSGDRLPPERLSKASTDSAAIAGHAGGPLWREECARSPAAPFDGFNRAVPLTSPARSLSRVACGLPA